ncbi:hypothetical protein A3C91_00010 [Candidatus Azambacteria bacterium RIFCSPHIGHO2_02_FULL_52_12]|uniref:HTH cro/C1-type domain-containing protein n=1 Tax=Candidatus Azambacteria bacterium RIFCSPLOWO2_01_FULL_46_25 TaxID=1797298 RepID=A0A1F5BUP6_9BACT|nr:MAG: hypothetical protein A3C91_00010 [Candidatus Azambacteria bacterium RIFCSPHIGHO2_02_FULL_52_12]OGD34346.1 MAG: hypothetical protein A2988_02350 [Candidatus Azambacteria bacterium RIFCSPLOWO2_01_FULL_46_25]OGD37376.1 MAG: hypothetical protein A2850_01535 [Candidatus Azambacteria bacterium RIFCSPHIGHO2_01_FULL_51_74]
MEEENEAVSEPKFLVEIQVRARHHALVEYRRKNDLTQKELGRLLGISASLVSAFEKLRSYPKDTAMMAMLCDWLETTPDELFPPFIRDARFLKIAKQITFIHEVNPMELSRHEMPVLPLPDEIYEAAELQEKLDEALGTLTPREEDVLRKRFGLNGDVMTLEETAKEKSVTKERIAQIEAKALRKLRHPSRVKLLKPFIS